MQLSVANRRNWKRVQISNSEVEQEQQCQFRHYMAFGLGLQRNNHSKPLRIGNLGHAVLELYYQLLEAGNGRRDAFRGAFELLSDDNAERVYGADVVASVGLLFTKYVQAYADELTDFEVALVEESRKIQLEPGIEFKFTPDLLVKLTTDIDVHLVTGAFVTLPADSYVLMDHKFTARPFGPNEALMNAQLPKYMYALRALGFNVSAACFNQINYSESARIPFSRVWISPDSARIQGFVNEFLKAARRIATNRALPVAEYKERAERSFSKMHCHMCPFRLPCSIDLNGGDISRILATDYVENTYALEKVDD